MFIERTVGLDLFQSTLNDYGLVSEQEHQSYDKIIFTSKALFETPISEGRIEMRKFGRERASGICLSRILIFN